MSYHRIIQRLEDLHNVLAYCSDVQSNGKIYVFRVHERICINQERGALLTHLACAQNEIFPHEVREYVIPDHIEAKVKLTIQKIQATNWGWYRLSNHIDI